MLTLVVSNAENTLFLYKNNMLVNSISSISYLNVNPAGASYYIGSDHATGLDEFNGIITNVQLYDAALTPQQISQIYSYGPASSPPSNLNLSGWWPLAGNPNDYSGNNNRGTINYNVMFVNQEYPFSYNSTPIQQIATFNGVGGITTSALNVPGAHTISLWFSSELGSNVSFVSDLLGSTNVNNFAMQLCGFQQNTCGKIGQIGETGQIGIYSGSNPIASYQFQFAPREWYNVVALLGTNTCSLFVNGVNV